MPSKSLEDIWHAIESSLKPLQSGWVRRLVNPGAFVPVHAAVACHGGTRSLMIDIPIKALGILQDLPVTGGLSVSLVPPLEGMRPDQRSLAVELVDEQYSDIFTVFCADLIDRLSQCASINDAIIMLLARLERWQEFLSKAMNGLSQPALVGLFGELWVLKYILVPLGGIGLVESWTGARRAPQDFIVPGVCAIEVKTSVTQVLTHVRIHGERQLDDSGLACLFLACLRLERTVDGQSINSIVAELREEAAKTPEFASKLNKLLAEAGWLDRHTQRYEQECFRVAQHRFFRVNSRFPRLVISSLNQGIDEVAYRLDLKACSAFECNLTEFAATLSALRISPAQ